MFAKFIPPKDPKISIVKNPPLELRKMLRKIRFDMNDLKTLLDIPLAIMSEQNILALVAQNNENTDHVDPKDPGKGLKRSKPYRLIRKAVRFGRTNFIFSDQSVGEILI